MKHVRKRRNVENVVIYVILSVMSVLWLLPIAWLLMISFRKEPGAYTTYLFPKALTLDNYVHLFTETSQFNFPRWYMNTLLVAVCSCVLTTIMVLMLAYTFSRLRFPSRKTFMNIGLILGMFPGFMSMIDVYHVLKAIGLAKSLATLVLVYSGAGCLNYLVAKGFFDTISRALDEAALLDGASWHKPDHYFLLKDFDFYLDAKLRANRDYANPMKFARKCLANIASAGKFSSDRTIGEYARDIWHI